MRQHVADEALRKFNDLGFWVIEIGPAGHDESIDAEFDKFVKSIDTCLLYTSPSPRDS